MQLGAGRVLMNLKKTTTKQRQTVVEQYFIGTWVEYDTKKR